MCAGACLCATSSTLLLLDIQKREPVPVFQDESFVAVVMQGEGGEGMPVDEDHSDHEDRQSDHSDHDNDPENDREAPPPDNDDGKCFSFPPTPNDDNGGKVCHFCFRQKDGFCNTDYGVSAV